MEWHSVLLSAVGSQKGSNLGGHLAKKAFSKNALKPGTSRFLRRNKYKSYAGMLYRASTCPPGVGHLQHPKLHVALHSNRAPRADYISGGFAVIHCHTDSTVEH
eukprot:scaffold16057_cov79-Skeletonema_marinoi.AAC.1